MPRSASRTDPGLPPVARPGRRAFLVALGGIAAGAAGCSAVAPQERAPAPPGPSGPPSTPRRPGAQDGDEQARRALLSDVDDLRARVAALVAAGAASALVDAVGVALDGRSRALTTRADAQRPSTPAPAPPDGSLPALADALAVAATAAVGLLGRPLSGPVARLVAAVAAGHAVGADVLARASSLPEPQGLPAAGGPGGSAPGPPDLRPTSGSASAGALSRAREVEAQARYAYGVVAVHLGGDALAAAVTLRSAHDETFSVLDAVLSSAPGAAPGPRDAWALPFAVVDDVTAATLAATVEDGCAGAWADVVAASGGSDRTAAATAVTVSALQGARWRSRLGRGADLVPLPGLTGRT